MTDVPNINQRINDALTEARGARSEEPRRRLEALIADASLSVDDQRTYEDAAYLDGAAYDRLRRSLAKRLGIRPATLDAQVERARGLLHVETDDRQGASLHLADASPWDGPVDGAGLLEELSALFSRYVYFSNLVDRDVAALFTLGTYAFDEFALFPFLGITAVGENSGKTTLSKCVKRLAYHAVTTSNVTPAALFRLIELYHPTIVIDEMDTFLKEDSELYGILNSGHDREMAYVTRTVGDDHEPRNFSTWCPRVWSMIGLPKRTIMSRSLVVSLMRKPAEAELAPLPRFDQLGEEWTRLGRQCSRWVADHREHLKSLRADVGHLTNRASDNWEPLYVLALEAGGSWLTRVRQASQAPEPQGEEAVNITLLRDLRNIYHTRKSTRLPGVIVLQDLLLQPESPWRHYEHHQPLTAYQLGMLLNKMSVRSAVWKDGGKAVRGFRHEQLRPLFHAYLNGDQPEEVPVARVSPSHEVLTDGLF